MTIANEEIGKADRKGFGLTWSWDFSAADIVGNQKVF
jgi:hypothetical protein